MYKIKTENIGDVKKYLWHYRKDNKEYGPFTYEDILDMASKGEIGPEDYVLKFGNKKFIKASEVQGLFEVIEEHEERNEEEIPVTEVQPEKKDEHQPAEQKELHITYDNRTMYTRGKHRNEPSGYKKYIIAACLAGLCLAVWLLLRFI